MPEGISIVKERQVAGDKYVRCIVQKGVAYCSARASIYSAGSPVGKYLNTRLIALQPNVVGVTHAHTI